MTALRRIRPLAGLALPLVLSLLVVGTSPPASPPMPDLPAPSEVVGSGDTLGCIACIAAGTAVAAGGVSTILIVAASKGSAIGLVTCAVLCANALS